MKITDSVTLLGDARVSDEGYLEANARTARTGVQLYEGRSVGRPGTPIVAVYRDESEVFAKRSLDTFSKLPVTVNHPAEKVTADNWRDHAVGVTGDEVLRDGEFLKIGLKITDAAAVRAIRGGKRQLSVGYDTVLVFEDGIAPDGTAYQARQTNIIANHIAIVDEGRAGPEVRIGDDAAPWGASPIGDAALNPETAKRGSRSMTTRTIMVDGLSVDLTDQHAQIVQRTIDALNKQVADAAAATTSATAAHATAIAAKDATIATKDTELATKDGQLAAKDDEIEKLKGDALTADALDKLVASRAALLAKAVHLAPKASFAGLTDAAIRSAVVAAVLGDAAIAGEEQVPPPAASAYRSAAAPAVFAGAGAQKEVAAVEWLLK